MPELILFRHGKSDRGTGLPDMDRPLNKRGRKAAVIMGEFLAETDQVPGMAVISPSVRTRQTLELAARAGSWKCEVRVDERVYCGGAQDTLAAIRDEPDSTESLLVVGHEPSTSELLSLLVGGGDFRIPTAAMARIELGTSRWSQVGAGAGRLIWLVPPKLLGVPRN